MVWEGEAEMMSAAEDERTDEEDEKVSWQSRCRWKLALWKEEDPLVSLCEREE